MLKSHELCQQWFSECGKVSDTVLTSETLYGERFIWLHMASYGFTWLHTVGTEHKNERWDAGVERRGRGGGGEFSLAQSQTLSG